MSKQKDAVANFIGQLLVFSVLTAIILFFLKWGLGSLYEIVQLFQK